MTNTGTFVGHAVPGTFFIVFGVWWTFHTTRIYILSNNRFYANASSQRQSSSRCVRALAFVFFKKALLLEGVCKVLASVGGAIGEATSAKWTMLDEKNRFYGQNDWHHVTMYMFFAVSGVADILGQTCLRLAPGRDKLYLSMAFAAEGFLFHLHSTGGQPLDAMLHQLLAAAIFACALSSFLEMWLAGQRFLPFFRVAFTLLQGTWFYQIGFTLFGPVHWDETNGVNIAFIAMAFTWHCLGVVCFMNLVYAVTHLYYRCRYGKQPRTGASVDQDNIQENGFELDVEKQTLLGAGGDE